MRIFHPYNPIETHEVLKHCLKSNEKNNCAIRISIGPMPVHSPKFPTKYKFEYGKGSQIIKGKDALIFTYGQTMISETFKAAQLLRKKNIFIEIINIPCLNFFDKVWFIKKIKKFRNIFFIDDHNTSGGMGDLLISFFANNNLLHNKIFKKFGFNDFPACGTYDEVLKYHKLDYKNLANQIIKYIKR